MGRALQMHSVSRLRSHDMRFVIMICMWQVSSVQINFNLRMHILSKCSSKCMAHTCSEDSLCTHGHDSNGCGSAVSATGHT